MKSSDGRLTNELGERPISRSHSSLPPTLCRVFVISQAVSLYRNAPGGKDVVSPTDTKSSLRSTTSAVVAISGTSFIASVP